MHLKYERFESNGIFLLPHRQRGQLTNLLAFFLPYLQVLGWGIVNGKEPLPK